MYAGNSSVPDELSQAGLIETEAQPLLRPYSDVAICVSKEIMSLD